MNFFSDHIRSLLFEDGIDSRGEFSGHRYNGFSRCPIARMALAHRAVELPKLRVLTDGRPGCYVDVKSLRHKTSYVFKFPDRRETGCHAWPGSMAVTLC